MATQQMPAPEPRPTQPATRTSKEPFQTITAGDCPGGPWLNTELLMQEAGLGARVGAGLIPESGELDPRAASKNLHATLKTEDPTFGLGLPKIFWPLRPSTAK